MNPQNPPNPPSETPPESKLRKYKKIIIIASIFFLVLILLTTFILLFTKKGLKLISFKFKNQPICESWEKGTISQQKKAKKTTEDISVFTPYSENIKSIRIINPLGEEVFAINLEGIKTTFNIEALVKKAQADLSSGKLNLTFISSNYTDMEQFAFDVKRFSDYVLTVEPFKKRSSQIV